VRGIEPGYEEKHFDAADKRGRLRLVASPDGRDGSVMIHQDACLYAGYFDGEETAVMPVMAGRLVYVHIARGTVVVNGEALKAGDALKMIGEPEVDLAQGRQAEVLVFELA
jgi:redox-sensitive bicupin YhaK (pirin superfamily)